MTRTCLGAVTRLCGTCWSNFNASGTCTLVPRPDLSSVMITSLFKQIDMAAIFVSKRSWLWLNTGLRQATHLKPFVSTASASKATEPGRDKFAVLSLPQYCNGLGMARCLAGRSRLPSDGDQVNSPRLSTKDEESRHQTRRRVNQLCMGQLATSHISDKRVCRRQTGCMINAVRRTLRSLVFPLQCDGGSSHAHANVVASACYLN